LVIAAMGWGRLCASPCGVLPQSNYLASKVTFEVDQLVHARWDGTTIAESNVVVVVVVVSLQELAAPLDNRASDGINKTDTRVIIAQDTNEVIGA
jgi:hypothetical protein